MLSQYNLCAIAVQSPRYRSIVIAARSQHYAQRLRSSCASILQRFRTACAAIATQMQNESAAIAQHFIDFYSNLYRSSILPIAPQFITNRFIIGPLAVNNR
jgi:hypothetical protein